MTDPTLHPAGTKEERTEPRLTPRQRDVLQLLAEGLEYDAIGQRLGIGSETVRTHLRKASEALGASTRPHAVAIAIRRGLL